LVPKSGPEQTVISRYVKPWCREGSGGVGMSAILLDVMLFACITTFYTGIVIAAANLLLG